MFKYTKASVNILIDDCKRYAKIFKYVSLVFTLLFLSYQVITGLINGNNMVVVNIALAVAFIVFTCLDFVFEHAEMKDAKKLSKRIYKWLKIATKAFTLGVSLFEIYRGEKTDGISIILATLMILLWIASFASEIIVEVVSQRAEEMLVAFKEDVEDIKRPFTAVSNTFKKMTGKYVEPEKDTKKDKVLSKLKKRIEDDKIPDEEDDE